MVSTMPRISEQPFLTASPISMNPGPTSHPSVRPPLPDRKVTSSSIEDAYVSFILHCNPAVPLDTDSTALREAFRTPPKSDGNTFSTFTLLELIKQFASKELKTWAELALKLGVEPPDPEKGQSSQKIQQYAVRLKRWMHSMHVDAFFEYLMDRPHPYWTEIPPDNLPITEMGRDGVAAEDDMALRALLPQIKPRRGRKRPDEDETGKSPSQRPSPQTEQEGQEPATALPAERGNVFLFPPPAQARLQPPAPSWGASDMLQTPLTAYPHPHSAITPSTRNAFWADEPRSAITPSRPGGRSKRHGAKVVSSAWRIGGTTGSGKTRGRPPNSRVGNADGPFSAFPATGSDVPTFKLPSPTPTITGDRSAVPQSATAPTGDALPPAPSPTAAPSPVSQQQPAPPANNTENHSSEESQQESALPPRPAKRSRLSLQVPARVGGEVRLATPPLPPPPLSAPAMAPPVVMINGQSTQHQDVASGQSTQQPHQRNPSQEATPVQRQASPSQHKHQSPGQYRQTLPGQNPPCSVQQQTLPAQQEVIIRDETDHTNKLELESYFMQEILTADWVSSEGGPIPPCETDEACAFAQQVVGRLLEEAPTKEMFLTNLAVLAGGKLLLAPRGLKITRLESEFTDRAEYLCNWQLRYGDILGDFPMHETVFHKSWKKVEMTPIPTTATPSRRKRKREDSSTNGLSTGDNGVVSSVATPAVGNLEGQEDELSMWKKRYQDMFNLAQQRDEELTRLRSMIVGALKDSKIPPPVDH